MKKRTYIELKNEFQGFFYTSTVVFLTLLVYHLSEDSRHTWSPCGAISSWKHHLAATDGVLAGVLARDINFVLGEGGGGGGGERGSQSAT